LHKEYEKYRNGLTEQSTDKQIAWAYLKALQQEHNEIGIYYLFPPGRKVDISRCLKIVSMLESKKFAIKTTKEGGNQNWYMRILPGGSEAILQFDSWVDYEWAAGEAQRKQDYKEQLELEKTQREIEKLRYEESIRKLDEEIKQLTAINLTLQNTEIIYRWGAAAVGLFAGFCLKALVEYWPVLARWLIRDLAQ